MSKATDGELKTCALEFVSKLRRAADEYENESYKLLEEGSEKIRAAKTEEQKNVAWNQNSTTELRLSRDYMRRYSNVFQIDAILLRDEMLKRLPVGSKSNDTIISRGGAYESPTNPLGIRAIIADLERLAKLL